MAALASVTKFTGKIVPTSKGVIQNFVTGVGADSTMRIIDNVFGAPVQRIFSFNVPLLGNIGPIDFLNYVAHAGGFKISKKGFIAVGAAKFANGALTQLGPIRLPQTVTAAQSTPSVASASGNSGGLPI